MNVSLSQSTPNYRVQKALLMYGEDENRLNFVTTHDVVIAKSGPIIKEGTPVTKSGLLTMLQSLSDHVRPALQLLDEHIIAMNDDTMMWWVPEQKRRIAFKAEVIGKRSAVVPHPPLLFWIWKDVWHVAALTQNKRPTSSSILAVSPYFNVWDNFSICAGSTNVPENEQASDPKLWTKSFYESAFTHTNCRTKNGLIKYKGGHNAFWIDMLDGKFESFPKACLVKSKMTLQNVIDQCRSAR